MMSDYFYSIGTLFAVCISRMDDLQTFLCNCATFAELENEENQ